MNPTMTADLSFDNPILSGFYPDPSICRVAEDYYLVTSSFAYFPGIPIFHSRDLVHWEQLGHVLDRPSQLDLDGVGHSEGIFAPTIRYHQGLFYVISTNISKGGNFVVTAADPAGPWSEPYWLPDAPGIDPSLFFTDDGRAYYVGTRPAPEGERYFGNWEIWLQELDLGRMALIGEKYPLWRGALREAIWPEGPHLYQIGNWFYLMIAEGGTDYHHAVTIARSRQLTGPYQGNPANPILTHRHLGKAYPIVNVGHADLVRTQHGEWWMVALASRPYGGYYRNLGRETFLIPLQWEDEWPIVSPGSGRIEERYPAPHLPEAPVPIRAARDDFDQDRLDDTWNFIRTPREPFWSLTARPGMLRLGTKPERLSETVNPAFVGRRQQHRNFVAVTAMEFRPGSVAETAGLALVQSNQYHFRFEYSLRDGQPLLRLVRCAAGEEEILAERAFGSPCLYLKVTARGQEYSFYYGADEACGEALIEKVDGRMLSTDVAGGFVGTYLGMFTSSNGRPSQNHADFDWFEYRGVELFQ
ncbi:alpha-N-arabinofuranosidase [Hydrogenispora ethanolica]|uniref:Alpha-N-arabinofuranosidase n=1 Tax=Hydrogenispora ethanolica TaxID=1082276 RepID=A0A4R1R5Q3_HYDET|nr:glycoside hydrolase family 43 protein [Hydrogenispora ethanolica]TCL60853.1 alpha-N-arabinofuranosidase [Hydrogenispora ethanolica]